MKTDCNPNRLRKYQERLETHRTSRSLVATPDWSIDLNRIVKGNGSFTDTWRDDKNTLVPASIMQDRKSTY